MTNEELQNMLEAHEHWIKEDIKGWENMRADLRGANLSYADLGDADLRDANLMRANLMDADLRDAKINIPLACPSEGSFIAWKKCAEGRLVKIFIYKDSKRSSATTNKCRTDKAKVLSIVDIDTGEHYKEAFSNFDLSFIYRVGEIVKVDDFDEDRFNECSPGIHFFIDKEAAINY